jgi:hypothetical protein
MAGFTGGGATSDLSTKCPNVDNTSVEIIAAENTFGCGRSQPPATPETVQRLAFPFVEQVIRPVDGVAQRLVALQRALFPRASNLKR